MRLGNITSHYTPFNMSSYPDALGSYPDAFNPSDLDCLDPSTNANLLGNIMAWFHDMNPQSIALIPSATSVASPEPPVFGEGQPAKAQDEENEVGSPEQGSLSLMKESTDVLASQLLELECVDDAQPPKAEPDLEGFRQQCRSLRRSLSREQYWSGCAGNRTLLRVGGRSAPSVRKKSNYVYRLSALIVPKH